MREFLQFVVTQLVDKPEEIALREELRGDQRCYYLALPRSEVGKVIGKQGNTIHAIRSLLAAASARGGNRSTLEIVERPEAAD